jgi:hypothetical protein
VRVSEDVLICGHNRKRASIEAKEPKVPIQRVVRPLTEAEEKRLLSELKSIEQPELFGVEL